MANPLSLSAEKEFKAAHRSSPSTLPPEWAPILNPDTKHSQPSTSVLRDIARLYNRVVDKYSAECDDYAKLLAKRKLFDRATRKGATPAEVAAVLPGFQKSFVLSAPVDDDIASHFLEYETALDAARNAATEYLHSVYTARLAQSDKELYRKFSALPIDFAADALSVITSHNGSKKEDGSDMEDWLSLVEQTLRRKLEQLRAEAVNSLGNSTPPRLSTESIPGKEV
ncbi:unnamed protein product [Peniophora sp. CBMAI 1063]|nr:unnamed protein product [Peniophora sp. CBMAI 1063]